MNPPVASSLLAFLSRRANTRGVYAGIAACLIVTTWATLTSGKQPVVDLGWWNYPWHELTIGAAGHVVLVVIGYLASLLFSGTLKAIVTKMVPAR